MTLYASPAYQRFSGLDRVAPCHPRIILASSFARTTTSSRSDGMSLCREAKKGRRRAPPEGMGREGGLTDPPTLHERIIRAGAPPRIDLDQRRIGSHESSSARPVAADPTGWVPIRAHP